MGNIFQNTPVTLLSQLRGTEHGPAWEKAWDEFVRHYQPAIRLAIELRFKGFGWHRPSPDLLAETSNDVFIRFLKNQVTFRYDPGKGKLRAYLTQMISGIVKDKIRSHSRSPLAKAEELQPETEPLVESLEDMMVEEDQAWKRATLSLMLEEARQKVSPQTYMIFELTKLQERPVEEVIGHLGVSRNTIDTANHRMLRKLQQLLDNPDYRKELLP